MVAGISRLRRGDDPSALGKDGRGVGVNAGGGFAAILRPALPHDARVLASEALRVGDGFAGQGDKWLRKPVFLLVCGQMGEQGLAGGAGIERHALAGRDGQGVFTAALRRGENEDAFAVDHRKLDAFAEFGCEPVEERLADGGEVDFAHPRGDVSGERQQPPAQMIGAVELRPVQQAFAAHIRRHAIEDQIADRIGDEMQPGIARIDGELGVERTKGFL